MSVNVAIVEDDAEVRNALFELFQHTRDFNLLGAYENAEDFVSVFKDMVPDVVVMDIHLPGNSGIDTVKKLKPMHRETQYLMFTVFEDEEKIFDSLCAGATGYLLKNTPSEKIVEAVMELSNGGSPMSAQIARKVVQSFKPKPEKNGLFSLFTSREVELLDYLSKGYRYKEIAGYLFISTETVRTHIRNIYQKLEVQSRTDALNKLYPRE